MVKRKSKVHFHLLHKFPFNNKKAIKKGLLKIFELEEKKVDEINYIFCSDDYLLNINKQFLRHDFFTDIITFPLHEEQEPIQADIFISIERVRENAQTLHLIFKDELYRVIIHGALHLCGYQDKTKSEVKTIREAEDKYLKLLSFT